MRVVLRPLAPREVDHELLWPAVFTGALVLGALWFALRLPWPSCAFHALTGQPCPTCGATRALVSLLHGDFAAAVSWNPLAVLAYCAIAAFNVYGIVAVLVGCRRLRVVQLSGFQKRFCRVLFAAAVVLNWIYLVIAKV
ncbi:MAG: DUF2752 domain-containing protein [Verrucomicrobia bacterium]|nr:DUF2752 domain-containing protein [Verrucomicrobiota bacterium]